MANKGMSKKGKIVLGSIAGFVALGVGTFFLVRNIKKNKSGSNSQGGGNSGSDETVIIPIKYIQNHGTGNLPTSINFASPRQAFTNEYFGKSAEVSGTGTDLDGQLVTLNKAWNANGNLGAIYVSNTISQQGVTQGGGTLTIYM